MQYSDVTPRPPPHTGQADAGVQWEHRQREAREEDAERQRPGGGAGAHRAGQRGQTDRCGRWLPGPWGAPWGALLTAAQVLTHALPTRTGVIERWELLEAQTLNAELCGRRDALEGQQRACDVSAITAWLGRVLPELESEQGREGPSSIQDMEASIRRLKARILLLSKSWLAYSANPYHKPLWLIYPVLSTAGTSPVSID